jgi:hypothetical protein
MTWRTRTPAAVALAVALAGCSLLVHFNDMPVDGCTDAGCLDAFAADAPPGDGSPRDALAPVDAGADADPCENHADGVVCGSADPCNTPPTCLNGHCVQHPRADGTFCGYAGGCQCQYCTGGACSETKACPQGFNWEAGVDVARCCGGLPVLTNTNANCGVCGVECMTAGVTSKQDCQLLSGHYQCVNCAANSECWSGCCAIDTTPYHCSESDCNTGACVAGLCPSPSTCVPGMSSPNYCSYE